MSDFTVAVIGLGNMGSAHASCIAGGEITGMRLAAVCDVDEKKCAAFTAANPSVRAYTDYKALLQDKATDAVIIAVPHLLHCEMAACALEKGIHVLLEKPADVSVAKVQRLNEIAAKSPCVFGIMFNQRTHPLFQRAREIVQSGKLGQLKRTAWTVTNWYRSQHYYDSGAWRATWAGEGGGVLLNQAPHQLDLWQWICGMPKSVTAFCHVAKYHRIEVEDDVTIFTRYENGATGTFITSTGEYPGTNRLEIAGTLGKLVLEDGKLKWWHLAEDERQICADSKENFPKIPTEYEEWTPTEKAAGHKGILQNFADAVLHGTSLLAPGTDGIFELTLSNAASLSAWEGNREVTLPFDTTAFDAKLGALAANSQLHTGEASAPNGTYSSRWQVNW